MPDQPDWYPDPGDPAMFRYWDGKNWTNHTAPRHATSQSVGGDWYRMNGWRPASDGKWYPPDRTPGPGWWIATDGVWYPPTPVDPASKQRSVFAIGLGAAVAGWVGLGFIVMLGFWSDMDTACTANRGDAYRDCIRRDDEGALFMQALAMGLAVMGLVIVLASSVRQRHPLWRDPVALMALATSGLLFAASIGGWILGAQGGWAPERP